MHHEDYKGKTITVHTRKHGKRWTWTYQIDVGPIRNSHDRPIESEELMRLEAIEAAKAEIDRTT